MQFSITKSTEKRICRRNTRKQKKLFCNDNRWRYPMYFYKSKKELFTMKKLFPFRAKTSTISRSSNGTTLGRNRTENVYRLENRKKLQKQPSHRRIFFLFYKTLQVQVLVKNEVNEIIKYYFVYIFIPFFKFKTIIFGWQPRNLRSFAIILRRSDMGMICP